MKGYFSRIAEQSGLRLSPAAAGRPRPAAAESSGERVSPIEVEETAIIEPVQTAPKRKTETDSIVSMTNRDAPARRKPVERPAADLRQDPGKAPPTPVAGAVDPTTRPEVARSRSTPTSPPADDEPADPATFGPTPDEFILTVSAVAERTTDAVEDTAARSVPDTAEPAFGRVEPLIAARKESAPRSAGRKQYFARSAEMIARGDAEPEEAHEILLRDVQEWAADSPAESDAAIPVVKTTEPDDSDRPERRRFETEVSSDQPADGQPGSAGLAEQTLELSIGTINVVIDEEKPRTPEPAPRRDSRNASGKAESGLPRLSRHYL
jgi:hypothetical protein